MTVKNYASKRLGEWVNLCPVYVPLSLGKFTSRSSLGKFTSRLRPVQVWVNLCPVYVPSSLGKFINRLALTCQSPWHPFRSILAPFGPHFGIILASKSIPFGTRVCRAPAENRRHPRRKNSTFQGHVRNFAVGNLDTINETL